jgi:hypothetical protein
MEMDSFLNLTCLDNAYIGENGLVIIALNAEPNKKYGNVFSDICLKLILINDILILENQYS